MGKSYENFMCKKFFHPTAKHNIKKVWMREQELADDKREEQEAIDQFKREQDLFETKSRVIKCDLARGRMATIGPHGS